MNVLRSYEILLPLQFNDGTPVPASSVRETLIELRERFGGMSRETQIIRGAREYEGQVFHDDLIRIVVAVEDSEENRKFFVNFKERLKERFQQMDVWITTHLIEVI